MNACESVYNDIQHKITLLTVVDLPHACFETANELKNINYSPLFLIDIPEFTLLDRDGANNMLNYIYKYSVESLKKLPIAATHVPEEIKSTTMRKFYKEFVLLQQLRRNEPEAWEYINELYEDD